MSEKPVYEAPIVEVLSATEVTELLGVVDCQGQSGRPGPF